MEEIQTTQKSAHRHCHEFLCDHEEKAKSEKSNKEIRCIRQHEETCRSWRAIKRSQGKLRSNGIASVQAKYGEGWEIIKDRDKVKPAFMNNNSARFNLTKKTPLMSTHVSKKSRLPSGNGVCC